MTAVEELARELRGFRTRLAAIERGENLAFSSFEGGGVTQYNLIPDPDGDEGDLIAQIGSTFGQQYDGTNGVIPFTGPVPPAPAAPTLTPVPGGVIVGWAGDWALSVLEVAPLGFTHVEVHVSVDGVSGILFATKRGEIVSARGGELFVPVGGGVEVYAWLVARTSAGKASIPGPVAGPVAGGKVTEADLDIDLSSLGGGTTIWYGATDPAADPANTVRGGDLWLKEPENVPYRRVVDDLGAASWVAMRDPDIAAALSEAAAAASVAGTKASVFPQASAPTTEGRTLGDIWVDIDDDGKQYIWDGAWTPRLIGNNAIEPGSLIASDVIATGSIEGDQISATAIDGKTITGATIRTASGAVQRLVLNSLDGLVGYGSDGTTIKTQVGTDGILHAIEAIIQGELRAGTGQQVRISQVAGLEGGGVIELYPTDVDVAGGNGTPGELQAASDEFGMISALRSPGRVTDGASSDLILRALGTGAGEGARLDSTGGIVLKAGGDPQYNSIDLDGRTRVLQGGALVDPLGYINSGMSGALSLIAGATVPAAGSPFRIKTYTATLTANASGDNTAVFPGGAFPNGLVALLVSSMPATSGGPPGANIWLPWGYTRSLVNLRCYNVINGAAIPNGVWGVSIIAIGW